MIGLLKKYKAFGIGLLITLLLRTVLLHAGFIKIDNSNTLEIVLLFVFWWFVLSLPFYKYKYLKENKVLVFKILSLVATLIITITIDQYFSIPDNPLTILLLVIFWVGVLYVVSPSFFNKYKYHIAGVYGLVLTYFSYVRLSSESFSTYAANSKEGAIILMIIPIPIFALVWVYEQWKWLKSLQADKSKAELELLKTQVNPHFFFNTLNNLYSLTVKQSDKAPEVILKLSEMMRYTIYEGKKETVSIKDEVNYLENYIELHKIRYQKNVDINFSHSFDEGTMVAPLLFIILLENAFKHGVESLSDQAYIKMDLIQTGKEIHFAIENNFDPKEISDEKGIGLENLKRRLELIYPKKHELTIEEQGSSFKAELKIIMP